MGKKYLLAMAVSALLLTACGGKQEGAGAASVDGQEEKVLNFYNWPDYISEDMVADFEQETGIKVNYQTFENNEMLNAKLVAGNS